MTNPSDDPSGFGFRLAEPIPAPVIIEYFDLMTPVDPLVVREVEAQMAAIERSACLAPGHKLKADRATTDSDNPG